MLLFWGEGGGEGIFLQTPFGEASPHFFFLFLFFLPIEKGIKEKGGRSSGAF